MHHYILAVIDKVPVLEVITREPAASVPRLGVGPRDSLICSWLPRDEVFGLLDYPFLFKMTMYKAIIEELVPVGVYRLRSRWESAVVGLSRRLQLYRELQ